MSTNNKSLDRLQVEYAGLFNEFPEVINPLTDRGLFNQSLKLFLKTQSHKLIRIYDCLQQFNGVSSSPRIFAADGQPLTLCECIAPISPITWKDLKICLESEDLGLHPNYSEEDQVCSGDTIEFGFSIPTPINKPTYIREKQNFLPLTKALLMPITDCARQLIQASRQIILYSLKVLQNREVEGDQFYLLILQCLKDLRTIP